MLLEIRALCFSSFKHRKLKAKLWWVGGRETKKYALFVTFILSKGNFCSLCILFQCLVNWINFQNTNIFSYQKALLDTLFCLFLKLPKDSFLKKSKKNFILKKARLDMLSKLIGSHKSTLRYTSYFETNEIDSVHVVISFAACF